MALATYAVTVGDDTVIDYYHDNLYHCTHALLVICNNCNVLCCNNHRVPASLQFLDCQSQKISKQEHCSMLSYLL